MRSCLAGEPSPIADTHARTHLQAIAAARARIEEICSGDGGGRGGGGDRAPPKPLPDLPPGTAYPGVAVKNVVPFGVFVELEEGLDGFCHLSQVGRMGWVGGGGGVGWGGAGLARVEGVALTASLSSRPSSRPSPRPTPTPAPRRTAQLAGGAFIASMEDVEIGPGDIIDVEVTEVNELKRQVRVQVYLVG